MVLKLKNKDAVNEYAKCLFLNRLSLKCYRSVVNVLVCRQVKNAGRKLGRRCDMCSNYEKQLQAIQGQEAETRDQVLSFYCHSTNVCRNFLLTSNYRCVDSRNI